MPPGKYRLYGSPPQRHTSPGEIAVQQAIKDAGKGGGLIICSSNTLHPGVDPDNCIAMFEAVKTHGRYE